MRLVCHDKEKDHDNDKISSCSPPLTLTHCLSLALSNAHFPQALTLQILTLPTLTLPCVKATPNSDNSYDECLNKKKV